MALSVTVCKKAQEILKIVGIFRWCKLTDRIFATTGRPGNQLKVFQVGHHKVLYC